MTLRPRRQRNSISVRLGRLVEGEERQQTLVTALFVAAIGAVALILVGAIALSWYNDNLRALARVGSVEVGPQLFRDRLELEQWRIEREEGRITQAQIEGDIDAATAQALQQALQQRAQALQTTGLEDLIDLIFKSQLATERGIIVSDADVDNELRDELAGFETRHVLAIVVEPQAADEENGPTIVERRVALDQAEAALAAIGQGREWSEVALQYSTDDSAQSGGDLGLLSRSGVGDRDFAEALFRLDQDGTTGIVRGADGAYRIGRVTEIVVAPEQPGARADLTALVPEANLRDLLRYEVAADRLEEDVVAEALTETPEQVRIAVIYIEGLSTGDPEDEEGEIDYSEIVFAPDDDLIGAPDLAEDDPAWGAAKAEADATFAQLNAIPDIRVRQPRFEQIAAEVSDSPSSEQGGAVGFVTRSIPPIEVGDALFDATHTEGALIGPIRGEAAWYVLMFHERRASPEDRLKAVQDALAAPGADFGTVARELSEGPEKDDGGEVGWLTRDQLTEELADDVYKLQVDQVSEALELGDGHYFIKLQEKAVRPLDADQIPAIRQNAFDDWYAEKKDAAEANDTIVRAGEEGLADGDLEPGGDQLLP